jgi:hypothetical protein
VAKRITDFSANPRNPRTITAPQLAALKKAMLEFGDLSGLVVNRESGHMIGGHQRVKILGEAPVTVVHRFDPPTVRGTVAEGFVLYEGERYVYREVRWTTTKERAAMVAANKHGGDFDADLLDDLLSELRSESLDMELTGFDESELSRLLGNLTAGTTGAGSRQSDDMRIVQLLFNVETLPIFLERIRQLGEVFGLDDVSMTVYRAIEEVHHERVKSKIRPPLVAHAKQRASR